MAAVSILLRARVVAAVHGGKRRPGGGGGVAEPLAVDRGHLRGRRRAARRGRVSPSGRSAAGEAPRPESRDTASWLFYFLFFLVVVGRGLKMLIRVYNTLSPFSTALSNFTVKRGGKQNWLFPEK